MRLALSIAVLTGSSILMIVFYLNRGIVHPVEGKTGFVLPVEGVFTTFEQSIITIGGYNRCEQAFFNYIKAQKLAAGEISDRVRAYSFVSNYPAGYVCILNQCQLNIDVSKNVNNSIFYYEADKNDQCIRKSTYKSQAKKQYEHIGVINFRVQDFYKAGIKNADLRGYFVGNKTRFGKIISSAKGNLMSGTVKFTIRYATNKHTFDEMKIGNATIRISYKKSLHKIGRR